MFFFITRIQNQFERYADLRTLQCANFFFPNKISLLPQGHRTAMPKKRVLLLEICEIKSEFKHLPEVLDYVTKLGNFPPVSHTADAC